MSTDFTPDAPVSQGQFRKWRVGLAVVSVLYAAGLVLVVDINKDDDADARKAIVSSARVVAVDGCNRDFNTIAGARRSVELRLAVLEKLKIDPKLTTLSPGEVDLQIVGSKNTLRLLPLPDCRKVEELITDDPRDTKYPPPNPLYPDSE